MLIIGQSEFIQCFVKSSFMLGGTTLHAMFDRLKSGVPER